MTSNEVLSPTKSNNKITILSRQPQMETRKSLKAIQRQVEKRNRFHYKVEKDFACPAEIC